MAQDAVLDQLGLTGHRATSVEIPGDGVALFAEIDPREYLDVWLEARNRVDDFGRWPVVKVVNSWDQAGWDLSPQVFAVLHPGPDPSAKAVIERASTMDFDLVLEDVAREDAARGHASAARTDLDATIASALASLHQRWGSGSLDLELRRVASEAADPDLEIERFLFDWERRQRELPLGARQAVARARSVIDAFPPQGLIGNQCVVLVLLPTIQPWEVYAYLEGLYATPADRVVAAARSWHDRFGAEPVQIHPGYATHLRVRRPPSDLDQAWRLAVEHYLVAWDTLALPGIALRDYAYALVGSEHWYLKSKP